MGLRPSLLLPLLCLFVLARPAGTAHAAWGKGITLPPPAPVVDEFGLLGDAEFSRLTGVLRSIKRNSGVEVVVFIPASLRGEEIAAVGIAAAEQWKLGRKKEDKGLILLVAPKEHKMRIEVGYGLEGEITDAFSRRVLDEVMAPHFRSGRYYEGILSGLLAIQEKVPLGIGEEERQGGPEEGTVGFWKLLFGLPFWAWILIFYLAVYVPLLLVVRLLQAIGLVQRPRRVFRGGGWGGGSWGGGGFGGGSWGGGGGSDRWGGGGGGFGGGGASSSW